MCGQVQKPELAQQYNRPRSANDLYRNTAGEIEARDAAARRSMTPEERKNTPPDLGGEETVFMEGRTGIELERSFAEYPYDMQTVIREYLDSPDERVLAFVDEVRSGKAWPSKKVTVGTAGSRMARDILALTGVDNAPGVEITLNTSAVRHILRRHGEHGEHDHSMSNDLDIARIGYVLRNYDKVDNARRKSGEYKNRDGSHALTVELSKKINGTYFVIEAVPDTGKIAIVSAYIGGKGAPQVLDDNTPSGDVRNELASAPNETVPNRGADVKQYSVGRSRELSQTENEAVRIFGTTKSFAEAGYLMPDGSMLRLKLTESAGIWP